MRYTKMGVAAALALLGAASLATAQQAPVDKDKGPTARDRGPEGKGQREPGATQQPRQGPKATEQPDRDRPKATEQPDRDRPKATEQPGKDRPKATEQPDRDRPKAAQPDTGKNGKGRVQVSEKQRTDVGVRLRQTRVQKTKVNVRVNIGSRIPRTARLHLLPAAIYTVAPAYRGYSYVVLDDETIVIVDARTYVIVDVIPAGTERVALALSADQMRFIYTRVPKDRSIDVRVRLALGAEVPRNVELLPFPGEVVERIPEVGRYRFVVANNDVVIVDPSDHSVVLVINE